MVVRALPCCYPAIAGKMNGSKEMAMSEKLTEGVFQVGVMVSDIDECIRLFHGALGMDIVFEARNVPQREKGLTGVDLAVMDVLMLHGEDGVDLEIHRYVDPPAVPTPPLNHNQIGSMHFMLRCKDIGKVVERVTALGYKFMIPVVESPHIPGFKYTYFRGPDGMMVELHEGISRIPSSYKGGKHV